VQTQAATSTITSIFEVTNTVLSTQPSTQSLTASLSPQTFNPNWLLVITILVVGIIIGTVVLLRKRQ